MAQLAERYTPTGMSTDAENRLEQGLVPLLPDDVALQCLLRVPAQAHSQLQGVCRKWRDLVNSSEFYEYRKKEGTTGHSVCLLQAVPQRNSQLHPSFSVSILNEKTQQWERLPPIPGFEAGLPLFCRFAAVGGNLVVLGGWDPSSMAELRGVYVFSFSTRLWRRGADMPSTRSFFSCGVLHGECILVAGGHDRDKNALRTADRYNVREDRWEPLPSMHRERDECASAVLNGQLFVISGYDTAHQGEFRRDAEVYNPELNSWTHAPSMWSLSSKSAPPSSVVATAGNLFAFHHNQLVCYSTKEGLWHVVDTIPEGLAGISAVVCATGFGNSIIVSGPSNAEDGSHRTLVYRLPADMHPESDFRCKGRWETVPVDEHFLGIAHVSCVVEV